MRRGENPKPGHATVGVDGDPHMGGLDISFQLTCIKRTSRADDEKRTQDQDRGQDESLNKQSQDPLWPSSSGGCAVSA